MENISDLTPKDEHDTSTTELVKQENSMIGFASITDLGLNNNFV